MQQQTTLTLDENLFIQAAKLIAIEDKSRLVEIALQEFIQNHQPAKKMKLLDLYGMGGIREDYDYKKLRTDEDSHVLG